MSLAEILKNPFFLKDREELLNYQLYYEIKKVGLESKIDFELLEPIIDKNGYDLLVKFRNVSKAIQLKCAERDGTSSWDINKYFFRPTSLKEADTILNPGNAAHIGLGGGIIVIEYFVKEDNEVEIKYFYTDFVCISFFLRNLREWPLNMNFPDFITKIFDDKKRKFALPKSLFFEVTIEQFLYLSRLLPMSNSLQNTNSWFFNYPHHQEVTRFKRNFVEKKIHTLIETGVYVNNKINIFEIFDFKYESLSINDKLII